MINNFEQKIDDLKFQYESGITETITKSLEKKILNIVQQVIAIKFTLKICLIK